MIGKLFNGRYRIDEKLGAGGTAIVYRGQDTLLHRAVTIKILREEYANNQDFVRRFNREAQAVASLSHHNIVGVYDVGTEGNLHYIVMEFIEGESLKDYINRVGALSPDVACNIIFQILEGLQHAHDHGIIHRDIKSHNILLSRDGRAKVTDFGIAIGLTDVTLTYNTSSRIMGSVHYISPEQVQGLTVTERSDIYSAGVVFYEMLTGRLPFVGETPISIAMQHVQGELVLPHRVREGLPESLSYVVMRAMRKNPDTRYASAAEMALAVHKAQQEAAAAMALTPDEDVKEDDTRRLPLPFKPHKKEEGTDAPPLTDEERQTRRRLSTGRIALLGVAALLVLGVLWVAGELLGLLNFLDNKATVPQFIGMTLSEAQTAAEKEDLLLEVEYRYSSEYEENVVMAQDVAAEQEVSPGRTIGITVSQGEEKLEVPPLEKLSQRIAELTLANLGLTPKIATEYNEEVPKGQVIMQSPVAGSMITRGSEVTLLVSLGAEPLKFSMARLIGYTVEDAQAYAADNGLTIKAINYADSSVYSHGQVIDQSLTAGTTVQTGDELELTVSQGPGPKVKKYSLRYLLPTSGDEQLAVSVWVDDAQGSREVFSQEMKGGNYFSYDVEYYNSGTIELRINDDTVISKEL